MESPMQQTAEGGAPSASAPRDIEAQPAQTNTAGMAAPGEAELGKMMATVVDGADERPKLEKRVSEIPLRVMVSKGFDDTKPEGLFEKLCCGCVGPILRLILCAGMGSFLFGFNLSLLNTSVDTISVGYKWCNGKAERDCRKNLLVAFIKTAVFVGAAIGSMTGGRLIFIGRRMLVLVTMAVVSVGVVSSVVSNSFSALLWARLVVGYSVGVISVIIPTYMSEMTPPTLRGAYGVFHQLFITVGIFVGVLLGLPLETVSSDYNDWSVKELRTFDEVWWRVMLGLGIIPVMIVFFLLGYIFTFETPHYYVENDSVPDAERLLKKLRKTDDIQGDLEAIKQSRRDAIVAARSGLTFWKAMGVPTYRNVIVIGCLLAAFQQLGGINVFISSSNKLFKGAGLKDQYLTYMSLALAGVNVIMTFPSIYLIEKLGRRTLLLIGTIGMGVAVLPGAILLNTQPGADGATYASIAGSIVFIVFFAATYGPVLWVYLFEIYPLEIKGVASGLATAVNWIAGIVMVFVTEFIDDKINYIIFSVMSFIGAVIVFFTMRETRGRSLEASPYMVDKNGRALHLNRDGKLVAE